LVKAGLTGRQTVDALGVKSGDRVLISGALGMVGRAATQYLQEIGAKPVAGVRAERLETARALTGEAIDITEQPAEATFDFAISTAPAVVGNLVGHVRDSGQVASIVQIPEGVNVDNRVTIHELRHRTDVDTLNAVLKAASEGALIIPIAKVFPLSEVGAAQSAVAVGVQGKVVLKH
jgi:NADPH:quinone reductase-like Zn-dependent oxidoreductase